MKLTQVVCCCWSDDKRRCCMPCCQEFQHKSPTRSSSQTKSINSQTDKLRRTWMK